ncbi:MAG: hypothetical protein WBP56_03055 [Polyangia bacterium]
MIEVKRLGDINPSYEELARGVLQEEGLEFAGVSLSDRSLTVSGWAATVEQAKAATERLKMRLSGVMHMKTTASSNTTNIGKVVGPVHTGGGDMNVQITVTMDVLLQKLDSALTSAGVPPDKKEGFMKSVRDFFVKLGTDVAAKVATELLTKS